MRHVSGLVLLVVAAGSWLAAGPGGVTLQALLACRHHVAHQSHPTHGGAPADGPCFCDEMTGGSDLAVSTAVPGPVVPSPALALPAVMLTSPSLFPLPSSPAFTPASPPPIGLG